MAGANRVMLDRLADKMVLNDLGISPKWYPQSVKGGVAICVSYFDARDVAKILDYVLGSDNWKDEYHSLNGSLFCRISVRMDDGDIIYREDVGTESNMSPEKGAASDAFKRAAAKLGVRFAYELERKRFNMDGDVIVIKEGIHVNKRDTQAISLYCNGLNSNLGMLARIWGSDRKSKPDEIVEAFTTLKQYYS